VLGGVQLSSKPGLNAIEHLPTALQRLYSARRDHFVAVAARNTISG
jgi:hypothetical protein